MFKSKAEKRAYKEGIKKGYASAKAAGRKNRGRAKKRKQKRVRRGSKKGASHPRVPYIYYARACARKGRFLNKKCPKFKCPFVFSVDSMHFL